MSERTTDILIVGGGTGGCAAAMAAASMGYKVVMTEETDWLGGQLTSQAVPPDENRWIEETGCTRRYRAYRDGVRQYYRDHYPLNAAARANPRLNPGGGGVSRICHEPRVGVAVLDQMLAYDRARGRIETLLERKPVACDVDGDRVRAVTLRNLRTGDVETIAARYVLDATELGDLLPLAGVEYVSGAESKDDTGELHAVDGPARPDIVQSISWCFAMGYDPEGEHVIEKPEMYDFWRDYTPDLTPAWPGKLLSWKTSHPYRPDPNNPGGLDPNHWTLLLDEFKAIPDRPNGFKFRQIVNRENFEPGAMPYDVTLVNWPQIDYWLENVIDAPEETVEKAFHEAKQQSLSFVYWMQTEAPRHDGKGTGYPGLFLSPELLGTDDGFAKYPYIRESRRIKARFTVTEEHVGYEQRKAMGLDSAAEFADSVGVGSYRIDLHPSTGGVNYIDVSSLPFQIPLGALVPERVENLLPACKNLGVTHISNGCYRLHPVEWNIGEAAGLLAAYCLTHDVTPQGVHAAPERLADFQKLSDDQGFVREWPYTYAV